VVLLHTEARRVALCASMLTDAAQAEQNRGTTRRAELLQAKLFLLWDDLDSGKRSVDDLLQRGAQHERINNLTE